MGQEVGKTGREGWHRAGGREDREGGMAWGRRVGTATLNICAVFMRVHRLKYILTHV